MSTVLKKHFKSPYPICSFQKTQELVAIDTIYSNTSTIDNISKVAQIFVGTESLVTNIFSMKA